jgi:hypothetical protein
MSFKIIIKTLNSMGYTIVHDKNFYALTPLTRENGRYLVSNCEYVSPFFIVPPAKSFWFHVAGEKIIVGLWSGVAFLFDSVVSLLESLNRCFYPQSDNFLNQNFIKEHALAISIYSLVIKDRTNTKNNIDVPLSKNKYPKEYLPVLLEKIINFISLHAINYKITDDHWTNFLFNGCDVYFRIPINQDKPFILNIAVSNTNTKNMYHAIKALGEQLGGRFVE